MQGVKNVFFRYVLQAINYTVFMAIIWYFATSPSITLIDDDEAMLTIAFAHAGELREPCRRLSQEELMKLPPNMRKLDECSRERSPVTIEARLDGKLIYSKTMQAPGVYDDGGVDVYYNSKIAAGKHLLEMKMDDSVRRKGFNHEFEQEITIDPRQIMLVDFDVLKGFIVK